MTPGMTPGWPVRWDLLVLATPLWILARVATCAFVMVFVAGSDLVGRERVVGTWRAWDFHSHTELEIHRDGTFRRRAQSSSTRTGLHSTHTATGRWSFHGRRLRLVTDGGERVWFRRSGLDMLLEVAEQEAWPGAYGLEYDRVAPAPARD